jgi:hypothetical protein
LAFSFIRIRARSGLPCAASLSGVARSGRDLRMISRLFANGTVKIELLEWNTNRGLRKNKTGFSVQGSGATLRHAMR